MNPHDPTRADGVATMSRITCTHFGDLPEAHGGGISTVLALYTHDRDPELDLTVVPTYDGGARLRGLEHFVKAVAVLATRPGERLGVVHVHLSERGSFVREGALVVLGRLRRRPVVTTLHGASFGPFSRRYPRLVRFVLGRADLVLALSPDVHARVLELLGPGAPLASMNNPVICDEAAPEIGRRPPRVVFAGELGRRKGLDTLLAAWPAVREKVPDAELVLMGPPGDVEVGELPGVVRLGLVARAEVARQLGVARVAALPSREEVQPMVVLEAMEAGAVVVGGDVGAVREVLGDVGAVVPSDDVPALVDALVPLLDDAELATRTARRARERVRSRHSTQVVLQELLDAYRGIGIGTRKD